MKKSLLSLVALAFLTTSCNSENQKAEAKKNFVAACTSKMQSDFGDAPAMREQIKTFCECSADRIMETFTESELRKLDTNPDDPGLNAKRDEAIRPCREAFIQTAAAPGGN